MQIATLVLTHAQPQLTADTVDSIKTYVGDRVLVLVDEAGWHHFEGTDAECGFYHAHNRSPYRNYALGLQKLYTKYPDCDWYLYCEYDCLFLSDFFKQELSKAQEKKVWCVGVDLRKFPFTTPLLEEILGCGSIKNSYYFLGCLQFLHHDFVAKLNKGFLERFLDKTKDFLKGYFPGYNEWAFEEVLWSTLAYQLGGNLMELVCWKNENGDWQKPPGDPRLIYAGGDGDVWRGRFRRYPIRNTPEVSIIDTYPETSIAHPLKESGSLFRKDQKEKRRMYRKRMVML